MSPPVQKLDSATSQVLLALVHHQHLDRHQLAAATGLTETVIHATIQQYRGILLRYSLERNGWELTRAGSRLACQLRQPQLT
jgi:hypothetical protein